MTTNKKGLKGFQKLPSNVVKSKTYLYRLTEAEFKALDKFCKLNDTTKSSVFRIALNDFYIKNNISISEEQEIDPRQLRIE